MMKYTLDELRRIWHKIQFSNIGREYAAYWFSNVYFPQARDLGEYFG